MKLDELFEGLKGSERKAYDLGRSTGASGKPMAKQEVIERNMGPDAWVPYKNGYQEGKNIFDKKDPQGDARRAQIAAKTVKEDEDLNESAEKAAIKLARQAGSKGSPALSKAAIEKSFGSTAVKPYMDAYKEAKSVFDRKEEGDAWREKDGARRQGRNYHE